MQKIVLQYPMVIAIGGVSRSGKTFLADTLYTHIKNSVIIHQDEYIVAENQLPVINDHINWEIPEAIDWAGFLNAINNAMASGKSVIAEGLMVFQLPEFNKLIQKAIFITLSRETFISRKRADLRWGKEPDWYISHIWDSYLIFGQVPDSVEDVLILDGETSFDTEHILNFLKLPALPKS